MKFLVINGPNINMLGIREKDIYGDRSYNDLVTFIQDVCESKKIGVEVYQSNHEGDLITVIQKSLNNYDGIIINPAAYTHTSIGIMDAIKAVSIPTVEVHLTDPKDREDFRKISYVGLVSEKTISGKGFGGYAEAIEYLFKRLS